jgi:hypothetical protein
VLEGLNKKKVPFIDSSASLPIAPAVKNPSDVDCANPLSKAGPPVASASVCPA